MNATTSFCVSCWSPAAARIHAAGFIEDDAIHTTVHDEGAGVGKGLIFVAFPLSECAFVRLLRELRDAFEHLRGRPEVKYFLP